MCPVLYHKSLPQSTKWTTVYERPQKVFFCKEHLLILPLAGQLVKFCAGSYPRRTTQHLVLSVSTLKLQTIILLLLYLNFPVTLHHNISVVYSSTVLQYLLLFDGLPWKNCNLCYIICYTQFTHSRAISFGNINNPPALHWLITTTLSVVLANHFKCSPCTLTPAVVCERNGKVKEHMNKHTKEGKKKMWHKIPLIISATQCSNYSYLHFLETQHPRFCSTLH